jgi:DNA-binding NarL/FixJ family response regulator
LGVSYKTADNHIQNLYQTIGASSRTAAAMYAVEHGVYSS